MPRPHTTKIKEFARNDGTVKYTARPMVDGERTTVELGDERDGVTRRDAEPTARSPGAPR